MTFTDFQKSREKMTKSDFQIQFSISESSQPCLKKSFKRYNWPVIDVTRRSVEETAASVIKIFDIKKRK